MKVVKIVKAAPAVCTPAADIAPKGDKLVLRVKPENMAVYGALYRGKIEPNIKDPGDSYATAMLRVRARRQ